jgi:hypothetical protein
MVFMQQHPTGPDHASPRVHVVRAIARRHPVLAASLVLAHMYCAGQRSILLVAAWHKAFNFTSATQATGAVVGTVMSVAVICWALWVLCRPVG